MKLTEELRSRCLVQDCSNEDGVNNLSIGSPFYVGFDPTAPSLQIGNLVPLVTALRLARRGLKPIILFGGSTGSIGDPSGKSNERKLLSREEINANVKNHQKIVNDIFSRIGTEVEFVNNLDWTRDISILDFLRDVGKHFTVNYMIAKEVVSTRLNGDGISYTEFSYMILQAFDFLNLFQSHNCKLQIGGSDQWGNITAGLELIRKKTASEAYALSIPLIVDSQGKKFGKSEGATIWLDSQATSPYHFYQFWLNTPDSDVLNYLRIFTFLDESEILELESQFKSAPEKRAAQKKLAALVTTLVHGEKATEEAERSAQVLFGGSSDGLSESQLEEIFKDAPATTIEITKLKSLTFLDLLVCTCLAKSKGEARRLVESGGAYINSERVSDVSLVMGDSKVCEPGVFMLRSGKKNYHLVKVQST